MVQFARLLLLLVVTASAGTLVAADPGEVAALRAKAEKGNGLAMYNLGLAYAQGEGVAINLAEAFVWLSLAAENGATGKALDSVLGNISDAQLAEGRRRLAEYHTAFAARAAASTQTVVHRPTNRGFTLTTVPATVAPAPSLPSGPTMTPIPPPHTSIPGDPMAPKVMPVDEIARLNSELTKANATITEQAATISRLQEEMLRRLPVTSVNSTGPVRTSPGDGVDPRR